MFDHNIFQENLVGVDFCEKMVAETNPGVLEQANRTESPHAADHGYRTIGDIMRSLNPFSGEFYREALQVSRSTREMFCLMEGRHVHPSTLYPGGVGTTATIQLFTDYYTRLMRYVEFMKRVVPMHDDLFDFFYQAMPGYEEVGRRRILLGCWGAFQDPAVCNFDYRDMTTGAGPWGSPPASWSTASWSPTIWSTSTWASASCSVRRSTTTGRTRRCSSPGIPWATRSTGATLEPAHQPAAPEAGLRRQLQLGHVSPVVRRHRPPGPRHRRRPPGPAVVDGPVRPGQHRPPAGHRHAAWSSTCPETALKPEVTLEWKIPPGPTPSSGTGPAPTSRPMPPPPPSTSSRRRWPTCGPATPRPGSPSTCPTRASGAASPRPSVGCSPTTW